VWESPIAEQKLYPGDPLVIYTDGVTEAPNTQLEEYGEARLVKVIQKDKGLPLNELLVAIQASVQDFKSQDSSRRHHTDGRTLPLTSAMEASGALHRLDFLPQFFYQIVYST
jgi:hypothetical protein